MTKSVQVDQTYSYALVTVGLAVTTAGVYLATKSTKKVNSEECY